MNRKSKVDKSLFDFALNINSLNEITIKHLEKTYKIDSDVCKSKANKNCVNNVKCLNGLGEKSWLTQTDEHTFDEMKDTKLGRRLTSSFVGLKNLGATCYVNCLLQVWFHNPVLRLAIYNWRPEEDPEESEFNSINNSSLNGWETCDNKSIPNSCVGKLQYVFGLMQFGIRCSVDPTPIIKCLELDENKQQDAHEFSNLFFTYIERKLKFQKKAAVQQTIQNQYVGKFAYFTRCQVCNDGSERESQFYELDLHIKGCKDIYESLFEYLKEERLEGNNQYYCGNCRSKQNAKRFIELRKLPPILNLQLLRFVFDPQKDSLKKLNSFIRFPDKLDIKPYLNSDNNFTQQETTYNLSAVLIHRGPSAHSGHYIAHIKDRNTDFWYKFNDEKVEKIEGKKLKLDSDDGIEEVTIGNGDQSPKAEKLNDWHNSNNAYMLVYTNQKQEHLNLSNNYEDWNLPQYLINAIEKDNKEFEESIAEQQKQKDLEIQECLKHRSQVRIIYENLVALPNKPYDLISKKWLIDWLNARSSDSIMPVDNNDLLCIHSKLNFKALSSFKCISTTGADQIYNIYGGGPRLNRDSLCRECISKQVNIFKVEFNVDEDSKFISSQLKYTLSQNEESFWIGKDSLKSWKQIKMKSYENYFSNESGDSNNESKNGNNGFEIESFNDEVHCEHGELTPDEDNRRLISAIVWQTLKKHFPEAPELPKNARVCQKCVLINEELETVKKGYKEMAIKQKSSLPDLSTERKRLAWDELSVQGKYFALDRKFLTEWKRFINDPTKRDPPESIKNAGLLCAHQLFLYPPNQTEIIGTDSKFVVITKEEWETLSNFYSYDHQIYFHVVVDENNSNSIESTPTYCNSCHKSLVLEEERERLTYNNQTIYVRKTENNESHSDSTSEKREEKSESYETIGKKLKREETKLVYGNGDNQGLRRSSRRRKNKNEKEIKVSSDDTLLGLKIQIMNLFNVAPFDQHLSIDDRPLLCNENTLAQLRVEPFSIITLKQNPSSLSPKVPLIVDEEPSGDCTLIEDDYIKGSAPEIGFKGTQLQNH